MQAYTHMIWLNTPMNADQQTDSGQHPRYWIRALAGAFALVLVVVFSAALLTN
jgi:hypothetical protein